MGAILGKEKEGPSCEGYKGLKMVWGYLEVEEPSGCSSGFFWGRLKDGVMDS